LLERPTLAEYRSPTPRLLCPSSPYGSRTHLGGLKGRRHHRTPNGPSSGSGGARILVCGFSDRRYTVSATDPNKKGQASCVTPGPELLRETPDVTRAADDRTRDSRTGRPAPPRVHPASSDADNSSSPRQSLGSRSSQRLRLPYTPLDAARSKKVHGISRNRSAVETAPTGLRAGSPPHPRRR
jgi:hypothetical protein